MLPSDGAAGDFFAHSVSVSGDNIVVGAVGDDGQSGSAYVFRWNGSSWVQQHPKLLALDRKAGDQFGYSVSTSGDVAVVAAWYDDDDVNGTDSGSAYVFRWNGSSWIEEQKLVPSPGAPGDLFGTFVSVSGDVILVGAYFDDDNGSASGSAYVFRYDASQSICGERWCEEQKLLPSDGAADDVFGCSVSVSGDVAIAGARLHNHNGTRCGSAYVFRWNGSSWVEEQELSAFDGAAGDEFGHNVSISGEVAVVGAHADEAYRGSAYVFRWNGSTWVQEQKLLASDGATNHQFGWSTSVSGDVIVVGALLDDDNGGYSGSAYLFRHDPSQVLCGQEWCEEQKLLASDGAADDVFGHSVSVSGNVAAVGAHKDDDNGGESGSGYVFNLGGTCCISNGSCEAEGNCRENITQAECQALGGRFFGPNLSCTDVCANGACIPAVSTWGIIVLLLLLTSAGTVFIARRARASHESECLTANSEP